MTATGRSYQTVKVEREEGITWAILNRPEKRNAMNPTMHYEMVDILSELEEDPETKVLVLTGAGESWCAGQDLQEFFRALDDKPVERRRAGWASQEWRWRRLFYFPKPTIAMVNGYCFGGAFTPLIACDFAIAADAPDLQWVFELHPDGEGEGAGPSGAVHERFRTWKEDLRDHG